MAGELEGKVAVVTGGGSGIGRASALRFAGAGARVVVADLDEARARQVAEEIGEAARAFRVDVARAEEVEALVAFAVAEFGRLDVMFNNAGISGAQHPRLLEDDLGDFTRVIGVNLFGVMAGTRAAARHMAERGGGAILNNASIAGLLAGQALYSYRVSKAGVIHFTKCAAIDLAEYGIRVNCLVPGHIRTPLSAFTLPGMSEEQMARLREALAPVWDANQPLKRHGRPEDVAEAALFLVSDRAAQITGVALPVDGGITAGDPVNHLAELLAARARVLGEGG
ncbi:MAG: oxidoreductase [Porticoccaceae bacterium]|nr:MAG: oxidoreductase [Porticoccaceae bacterium]